MPADVGRLSRPEEKKHTELIHFSGVKRYFFCRSGNFFSQLFFSCVCMCVCVCVCVLTGQGGVGWVGAEGVFLVVGAAAEGVASEVEESNCCQPIPVQLSPESCK